jgi:hypothetical protein
LRNGEANFAITLVQPATQTEEEPKTPKNHVAPVESAGGLYIDAHIFTVVVNVTKLFVFRKEFEK